jgi:hypothetical protein
MLLDFLFLCVWVALSKRWGFLVGIGNFIDFSNAAAPFDVRLAQLAAAGNPIKLSRAEHRVSYLDEIDRLIGRFHPRCPVTLDRCKEIDPSFVDVTSNHTVAYLLVK